MGILSKLFGFTDSDINHTGGATEADRQGWKGRSDADRQAARQDVASRPPWRGDREISNADYLRESEIVNRVVRGVRQQKHRGILGRQANRGLDAAINTIGGWEDEPKQRGFDAEDFARRSVKAFKAQGMSDRQILAQFHPDVNKSPYAEEVFKKVNAILKGW